MYYEIEKKNVTSMPNGAKYKVISIEVSDDFGLQLMMISLKL